MAERRVENRQLAVEDVTGFTFYYGSEFKVDPDSNSVTVTGGESYDNGLKLERGLAEPGFNERLVKLNPEVGVTHTEVNQVLVDHKQVWPSQ